MSEPRIRLATTEWASLEFVTNELLNHSRVGDPAKYRLSVPQGFSESLGGVSWNVRRPDGGDVELGLVQVKHDERHRHLPFSDPRRWAAEFVLHLNDGTGDGDSAMKEVFKVRTGEVWALGKRVL